MNKNVYGIHYHDGRSMIKRIELEDCRPLNERRI